MKYTFVITYLYDQDINGVSLEWNEQRTITETTLEGAITVLRADLVSEKKTLKSFNLQVMEA